MLNDLANAEAWAAIDAMAMPACSVLYYLDPKICEKYLSSLGYTKLIQLADRYKNKKTLKRALAACNDIPPFKLKVMWSIRAAWDF
jgi:hypothetical protein